MRLTIRFLISSLIATTMLLGLGARVQAINSSPPAASVQAMGSGLRPDPPPTQEEIARERNAEAKKVYKAAKKALKKQNKTFKFKDADGKKHSIVVKKKQIYFDGKKVKIVKYVDPRARGDFEEIGPISLACKFKIAAALSAVLALGGIAIAWFVAPLAATASVALAGLTLEVSVWNAIAASLGSVGTVLGLLHDVMC